MIRVARFVRSNIFIKILSFAVAFSLWLYVMNEQNPSMNRVYTVPLERRNVHSALVVQSEQSAVRVRVTGPRSAFANLNVRDIHAYVDLQGLEKGNHEIAAMATVPSDLRVTEISPENVILFVDAKVTRSMPVEVNFNGQLPEKLAARTASLEPNTVIVQGGQTAVESINRIEADFILDRSMASKGEYKAHITLVARDKNNNAVHNVTIEPDSVALNVHVVDDVLEKEVPVKLSFTGSVKEGYKLSSTSIIPSTIMISGPTSIVEKVEEISVNNVNLNYLNNDYVIEVPLKFPDKITSDIEKVKLVLHIEEQ